MADKDELVRLRKRVKELESLLEEEEDTGAVESLAHQLEERERQLRTYAAELQQKNRQLQVWISSLELYQHIFESDPVCLLGVSREMKLLLFNKAAREHIGPAIQHRLGGNLQDVDFRPVDPYIPVLVQEAMKSGKERFRKIAREGRVITTRCYPLGSQKDPRGCLIRVDVKSKEKDS